jgi:hypothetical protein
LVPFLKSGEWLTDVAIVAGGILAGHLFDELFTSARLIISTRR